MSAAHDLDELESFDDDFENEAGDTSIYESAYMAYLESKYAEERALQNDRPTMPVPAPRESGVRLRVARVPYGAVTVDLVVCDLSRDRRSESYLDAFIEGAAQAAQNERPPSTSIVRALK